MWRRELSPGRFTSDPARRNPKLQVRSASWIARIVRGLDLLRRCLRDPSNYRQPRSASTHVATAPAKNSRAGPRSSCPPKRRCSPRSMHRCAPMKRGRVFRIASNVLVKLGAERFMNAASPRRGALVISAADGKCPIGQIASQLLSEVKPQVRPDEELWPLENGDVAQRVLEGVDHGAGLLRDVGIIRIESRDRPGGFEIRCDLHLR